MDIDWKHLEQLTRQYEATAGTALNVHEFNLFAVTHHSTKIEGSSLTEEETNALLEKKISIAGKPVDHQNMVLDHMDALQFILEGATKKIPVTPQFLKDIASKVMRRTGKTVNSALGSTDESKGDFRKVNVSAGGSYFVDQSKVVAMTDHLCSQIGSAITKVKSMDEIFTLAYMAHFDLVSIHPFTDGNGRVSRLLMNYIQAYHGQHLTIVHADDRAAYIDALKLSREHQDPSFIVHFLASQHTRMLTNAIQSYDKAMHTKIRKGDQGYSLIF